MQLTGHCTFWTCTRLLRRARRLRRLYRLLFVSDYASSSCGLARTAVDWTWTTYGHQVATTRCPWTTDRESGSASSTRQTQLNEVIGQRHCCDHRLEHRTRNFRVTLQSHRGSFAGNFKQVANLLCAQTNSASYPQRDGK